MPAPTKYRNAPLAYVIFQVVHPVAPPLTRGEEAGLKQALVKHLPLQTNETQTQLEVVGSFGGGQPKTEVRTDPVVRYSSRDKRTVVTFMSTSITLETSNYDTWDQFGALAKTVLAARMDVAPVDGVERIGLRYIDEIRVPIEERPDWSEWIDSRLAPPVLATSPDRLRVNQQQATIQYSTDEPGVVVTLRYGAVVGRSPVAGSVAQPAVPADGPFFLIDTDAAWTPGVGEEIPALAPDTVLQTADGLHRFVKDLFEASLTDRLRTEVLDAERI